MKIFNLLLIPVFCASNPVTTSTAISNNNNTIVAPRQNLTANPATISKKYFRSEKDLHSFCLYIKTQNYNDGNATFATIQVMLNIMDFRGIDWYTYYNSPKINNSNSIKRLKSGSLKKSFNIYDKMDALLLRDVKTVLAGNSPLKVPKNVLYFEACEKSPNKCVHKLKNLWKSIKRVINKKTGKYTLTRYYFNPKIKIS